MIDLPRASVPAAALAWASVTACAEPLADTLPPALAWTRALWALGVDRAPLFAVHDLGWILLRGNDFRVSPCPPGDREGRGAELAWRDRALGRWSLDPSAREAHVVLSATPAAERDDAVAHALSLCLPRMLDGLDDLPRGNPAHLRAAAKELDPRALPPVDPEWARWALDQRDAVLRALPAGRVFTPGDLWEIAHRRELPGEGARLALRGLHALADGVAPLSAQVSRALLGRAREAPVDASEADTYPAGGFDAIATRGSLENMVRSEAALVGEGVDALGGADLFDVRYATGELLYYTRDESPLLAARREVTFVFDRPADLRVKRPEHPAQALVMLDAAVLAAQRDLTRALGAHATRVTLRWHTPRDEDRAAADEERALLAIALAPDIAHRRVVIVGEGDVPVGPRPVIVLSPREPSGEIEHDAWLRASGDAWSLGGASVDPRALRELVDLLLGVIGLGR